MNLDLGPLRDLRDICRRSPSTTMTPDCVPVPLVTVDLIIAALERVERVEATLAAVALAHHGGSPHRRSCKVCDALEAK